MRRKFAERLFYWIGRRLGKLPTVVDVAGLKDDNEFTSSCLVKSNGRTYGVVTIVVTVDGQELVHTLSSRVLMTLWLRKPRTIGQCKRRVA